VIDNVLVIGSMVEIKPLLIRQMKNFKQHPKFLQAMTKCFSSGNQNKFIIRFSNRNLLVA
jgi:hypothetical protein